MDRRRFLGRIGAGVAAGASAGLAGCLDDDYDVGMRASAYTPETVTVAVGDTVVWQNTSTRAHTVTAYEGAIPDEADYFASGGYDNEATAREAWTADFGGALESGDRYSRTFSVPGRYEYVCLPHEEGGMYATVVVEE